MCAISNFNEILHSLAESLLQIWKIRFFISKTFTRPLHYNIHVGDLYRLTCGKSYTRKVPGCYQQKRMRYNTIHLNQMIVNWLISWALKPKDRYTYTVIRRVPGLNPSGQVYVLLRSAQCFLLLDGVIFYRQAGYLWHPGVIYNTASFSIKMCPTSSKVIASRVTKEECGTLVLYSCCR